MARKRQPKKNRIRSPRLSDVIDRVSNSDFFDYRLVVKPNGVKELTYGHTDLCQGLQSVETVVEELRSTRFVYGRELLMRSINVFSEADSLVMMGLTDLEDYYSEHPDEVRDILEGVKEMNEGRRILVKALRALDEARTGEALAFSRHALAHLREAGHMIGGRIRELKERCPESFDYEVLDLRSNDR